MLIPVPQPAAYLASKIEAFLDPHRENSGDPIASRDIADLTALVEGCPNLDQAAGELEATKRVEFSELLTRLLDVGRLREGIAAQFPPDDASQARAGIVADRLENLVS